MEKKSLENLEVSRLDGARVLVRVDFNVPIEDGKVSDDTRIRATLPTLVYLNKRGARTILVSHLGRPKAKVDPRYTLAPVADRLRTLIDAPIAFVDDVTGERARAAVDALQPGAILLLENVRFLAGEEANDPELCRQLADFSDVYVNDAFGTAHRAHASTTGVAEVVRARGGVAVAGFLMERELRFLGGALTEPKRPFIAILGGAKISGKIDVIESLLPRVDQLLIGGAMANTFFRGLGLETGDSLVEEDRVEMGKELMRRAGEKLMLPVDCVVANEAKAGANVSLVERDGVAAGQRILDIGPRSVNSFATVIARAATVVWNGPMGLFEIEDFAAGTIGIARAVAKATEQGAVTIAGGGDTAAALEAAGLAGKLSHVSTGGGASLEFLEGKVLPGVAALDARGLS
jgi:phosphoglycerate kinase